MKILAVDDEELILWKLEKELKLVFPKDEVITFDSVNKVREFIRLDATMAEGPDFAFLDINLGSISGIEVAREIRELFPKCKFIFCTAYADYALDAFKVYASGYLLKPVSASDINNLLETMGFERKKDRNIYIRTFGNFDLFLNDSIVYFNHSKAKELLAYLVDRRGCGVTTPEAYSILWEDYEYTPLSNNKVQHAKKNLKDTLAGYGIEDILVNEWNYMAIDLRKVRCDYYDYLNGSPDAANYYNGEYMTQYSWAERTTGALESRR